MIWMYVECNASLLSWVNVFTAGFAKRAGAFE